GYLNDPEKQEIRKLNFVAILSALKSIATGAYEKEALEDYQKIPENDSKLYDLKLTDLEYNLNGNNYILDIGINHYEVPNGTSGYYYRGQIADQGDLSTNFGYTSQDLDGYQVVFGKVHPKIFNSIKEVENLDQRAILAEGYSYVMVRNLPKKKNYIDLPVNIVSENFKSPSKMQVGVNPNFFLFKNGKVRFAMVNGFLVDLEKFDPKAVKNALILR